MSEVKLTLYGGVGAVTGANFLLETENLPAGKAGKKVLIDCGLLQGVSGADAVNKREWDYDPSSIDILFITHGHIDHIGLVPRLVKDGFKGEIYSTPETRSIAELMLMDMAKIADGNARREGTLPLYTPSDVSKALMQWKELGYHTPHDFEDFTVGPFDAGHILGSAMYKFTFPSGKTFMFTGDIGNSPSVLLKDTEKISGLSYLLMDSVYGDRNHESKGERVEKLKAVIKKVIENKGTLLIPVFSLERTQVILYELDNMFEAGELSSIPVFLDSPLAIKITDIYERVGKLYNARVQEEMKKDSDIFKFPKLRETAQVRDSREIINVPGPKIILAGSGMSTAGRIVMHEETFLPDEKTTLLLVGYQAPGTLGRILEEGARKITIDGREVKVNAHIEKIEGFSAHADSDALVEFVSHSKDTLEKVFVAMGEPKSSIFLAQRLHDELGVEAVVPERGKTYKLEI